MVVSVGFGIFGISLSVKIGNFFKFGSFLFVLGSSVNFFDLFRFKITFFLEFIDFCKFFVDISDSFGNSLEERLILLVYDLRFFRVILDLGLLRFFGHLIKKY